MHEHTRVPGQVGEQPADRLLALREKDKDIDGILLQRKSGSAYIGQVTLFSFFPDNTNVLWSLDLALWLSPPGYAPHVTHPLTEEVLCSQTAPASFSRHPLWTAPVGTGVPVTASREIAVASGQMGEKVLPPGKTLSLLFSLLSLIFYKM